RDGHVTGVQTCALPILEEVETRLEAIGKLKRKYGGSIVEILAFLDEARRQIAAVESAGERMEALHKEQKRLAADYGEASRELTRSEERRVGKEGRTGGT